MGGLGNQLFQYATARALSEKLNTSVVLDVSEFNSYDVHPLRLNEFNCKGIFSSKKQLLRSLLERNVIKKHVSKLKVFNKYYFERNLEFNEDVLNVENGSSLIGYFQTEKYFEVIRTQLLEELTLKNSLNNIETKVSHKINNTNSISIHIRRGDYISNQYANSIHGTCDSAYFSRAIAYMSENNILDDSSEFFVFSDDIEWCRNNLELGYKLNFVTGSAERPEVDMILMSQCKHQIISNSTFSWWGAWLNKNESKVIITPKKWFENDNMAKESGDIIPHLWVKL